MVDGPVEIETHAASEVIPQLQVAVDPAHFASKDRSIAGVVNPGTSEPLRHAKGERVGCGVRPNSVEARSRRPGAFTLHRAPQFAVALQLPPTYCGQYSGRLDRALGRCVRGSHGVEHMGKQRSSEAKVAERLNKQRGQWEGAEESGARNGMGRRVQGFRELTPTSPEHDAQPRPSHPAAQFFFGEDDGVQSYNQCVTMESGRLSYQTNHLAQ